FIETPFRNQAIFKDILTSLNNNTKLCVAVDLTLSTEEIYTKTIEDWKKETKLDLNKRPCIFLIG
ncbi:MAG TPA: SAM-dependent methyltransferase, partial [Vicingus sp.]|nr:SAM-dependent methyltransferase [Vicingus sp.]